MGNYLRGDRQPSFDFLLRMAEKGVDLNWLVAGEGRPGAPVSASESVAIPRYTVRASAGDGLEAISEEVADYFLVAREWIARYCPPGARLGLIEAQGDSMEPTIRSGDGLIVRFDLDRADIGRGGLFIINLHGAILVKRISRRLDGTVVVSSDNPFYPTETLTPDAADELLHIQAKVLLNIAPPRSGPPLTGHGGAG